MGTKLGAIKRKLGLRGKTKPGEMITKMNKMKAGYWGANSFGGKGWGGESSDKNPKPIPSVVAMNNIKYAYPKQGVKKGMKHKKMSMKQWEKSSMDAKADKAGKHGKEGSAKDLKADKKALAKVNLKKKGCGMAYKKKGIKTTGKSFGKSNRLGGGGRFAQVAAKAGGGKKGAAIAAMVGRKSLGKKKFQELAAKGRKKK
jgi:hypothetical protein